MTDMQIKANDYTEDDVRHLSSREAVRERPGMYIGSDDVQGLCHIIAEVIDNSADEAMMGECTDIWVEINKDQKVTITDNGRGMPLGEKATAEGEIMPTPQLLVTKLHAGGKFGPTTIDAEGNAKGARGSGYSAAGGLHGVGLKCANFLSTRFSVEIWRDQQHYYQEFINGAEEIKAPVIEAYEGTKRGTKISFRYDPDCFTSDTHIDAERVVNKLKATAYTLPGLRLYLHDARTEIKETYVSENGIIDLVRDLVEANDDKPLWKEPARLRKKIEILPDDEHNWKKGHLSIFDAEIVILPTDSTNQNEDYRSFVNTIATPEGGDHLSGAKTGLARAVKRYMIEKSLTKTPDQLDSRDILLGLSMALAVRMTDPLFSSQAKAKLNVGETNALTANLVDEWLRDWLVTHEKEAKIWAKSIEENREARLELIETKKAIGKNRRDKIDTRLSKILPVDKHCPPEKAEIFFVEGDSAGGSAGTERDNMFQAVLKSRGVGKNILGLKASEILNNIELATIAAALGLEYRTEVDEKNLRFHKIILLADADPDGGHINLLWLLIFYAEFRSLFVCEEHGSHIFIGNPPLFRITNIKSKEKSYVRDEKERDEFLKNKTPNTYKVERFKGLGEMNPDELGMACLDPVTRHLSQVTLGDAHHILLSVMGKGSDAARFRKEYLRHQVGRLSDVEELPDVD